MASNTLPITDRYKTRSISAPISATDLEMKKSAKEVLISAESAQETCTIHLATPSSVQLSPDAEVGLELSSISGQIQEELQGNNQSFPQELEEIVNAALRKEPGEVYDLFFKALENIVNRQVKFKTFVNISVFCIVMWRRYKEESSDNSRTWFIEQVVELMTVAYSRYSIDKWIEGVGGWSGVLTRVREAYNCAFDYVRPPTGRRGSLIVTGTTVAGAVAIATAGFGAWWYFSSK